MNAHTSAPGQAQALFANVPAASSSLLTRLDVSDAENVREARERLRMCRTEADFANWAATWGENLCARVEDFAGADPGDASALDQAEEDAKAWEKSLEELQGAVRKAIERLDEAVDGPAKTLASTVEDVSALLENAL